MKNESRNGGRHRVRKATAAMVGVAQGVREGLQRERSYRRDTDPHDVQERQETRASRPVADFGGNRREKARAVTQSTVRARRAPAHIKEDLKDASRAYTQSMTIGWGLYAGAGVIGAVAFIVLTVGSVAGFNALWGVPAGHFITVGLYLLIAGIIVAVGRNQHKKHREEAHEHVEDAREEAHGVTRPLKTAFRKDGR